MKKLFWNSRRDGVAAWVAGLDQTRTFVGDHETVSVINESTLRFRGMDYPLHRLPREALQVIEESKRRTIEKGIF